MSIEIKKILVTGGTGFVGKSLCERLLKLGYNIYILTRGNKHKDGTNIIYVKALNEVHHIDFDIIINLAGETISKRWTKANKKNIYNSRIFTTRDIVNYIGSKKNKPQLLISASAVGFYGTDDEKIFDEGSPISKNEQGFAKYLCNEWEEEAKGAEVFDLRVVILRIGPVLERNGGMLSKLFGSFYMGLGSQFGDGKQWISWIDRDDLIHLILFIIDNDDINGPINATSPNPVTNKDFSFELAKAIRRPCFFKIPGFIFKLIFGQMADEIILHGQKVLPKKALSHGFQFSYPTIAQSFKKIFR